MLTIAFIISALQLSATASPSPPRHGVQHVSLTRRQAPNATADRVTAHMLATLLKHDVGFDAFRNNTGTAHPLDVGEVQVVHGIAKRAPSSSSAVLTSDGGSLWTVSAGVGTTGPNTQEQFPMTGIDTASATALFVNVACTTTPCQNIHRFNPTISTTSTDLHKQFAYNGAQISGNQYSDTATIAGLSATGLVMAVANSFPPTFSDYTTPPDALMGVAFPAISVTKSQPFPQTLNAQGSLTDPVFAMSLNGANAELTLGGVDSTRYAGSIQYTPVTTAGFWQINFDSAQANGQPSVGKTEAILDTGSREVIGDAASVKKLYATIPGSQTTTPGANNLYTYPCDTTPAVSITIAGLAIPFSADSFNLGPVGSTNQCLGAIQTAPKSTPPSRYWTLGDAWLQNAYMVYNFGEKKVGVAIPS
ncbi:hypothetical protein EUX98_g3123 [Antrodiella citrinella]|uniref:Peptidase A1 domain-containing protein n=1 Tax=Antrodiella citrinella TaxID=2447956 RepID=A0A4S4MZV9_9APHY|nr:hypothetical protein EUX98_g3123 [Antrodiella citrinella]